MQVHIKIAYKWCMKENVKKNIVDVLPSSTSHSSVFFYFVFLQFFSCAVLRQQFLDSFYVNFSETNRVTEIYENSLTMKRDIPV